MTRTSKKNRLWDIFLLTRPSRDVTCALIHLCGQHNISTHTPLAGRDIFALKANYGYTISTHTPLAGRDMGSPDVRSVQLVFLLTRPSRDVTVIKNEMNCILRFLLTRPSRDVTSSNFFVLRVFGFLLTRPSRDVTATFCTSKRPHTIHLGTDKFNTAIISI